MTPEQLKHHVQVYAEAVRMFSVVRDIAQQQKSIFENLVRKYNNAPKRTRRDMQPEMALCWLIMCGAMRCHADYYSEVERTLSVLELALLDMAQRLGERLPEGYRSSSENGSL